MVFLSEVIVFLLTFLVDASSHGHQLAKKHSKRQPSGVSDIVSRQSDTSSNEVMIQGFEWYVKKDEQHWNRLGDQLEKLSNIGVDRIWIPPATKAAANPSTGYDVYDLWDLGEFNQKGHIATSFGTKDDLTSLSKNAATFNISILADAVINQRGGAETAISCNAHKVDLTNRLQSISGTQEIYAWVNFTFPDRNGQYSQKTWACDDFSGVDYDDKTKENAIWKLEGQNNSFALDVSQENGNYDYLIMSDVAYANLDVQADVKAWGVWLANELKLGGFRLDAAKHVSKAFLSDWVSNTVAGSPNLNLLFIAEYITSDVTIVQQFIDGFKEPISVFDTPLQTSFHAIGSGQQTDLRAVFNNTWLATRPNQAVTYVMNHDTQAGQALDSLYVDNWFLPLAYSLILLRQDGYPCIFYGDLYGVNDDNGTFHAPPHAQDIANMALVRKYFAYGTQTDYFNSANTIGWTRQGDGDRPDGVAVVMSNAQNGQASLTMSVGEQHAGEQWSSMYDGSGVVTISADGSAEFVAGAGTVNVYVRADSDQRSKFGSWDINV